MTGQESHNPETRVRFVYEDNHLLAADKPAGLPSQPDASGDPSLDAIAKDYLREKYHKPGNIYLALLHRLDRPTSGVVLLAKTDKAAGRMAALFRERRVQKTYLAVVESAAPPPDGTLADWLAPAGNGGMRAARRGDAGAREARLAYRVAARDAGRGLALLEIDLLTGVKHQIRCQLALAGMPVTGDFRYGPGGGPARPRPVLGGRAVLLHARRAAFVHPVRQEPLAVTAPLPAYWRGFTGGMAWADGYFDGADA